MKKAVVTAANSFIGKKLCRELDHNDFFIYAVVRNSFADLDMFDNLSRVKIIRCDMQDYDSLYNVIDDQCDLGITLAWNGTRGDDRNDSKKQHNNFEYSKDVIRSFKKLGCRLIVTAGSQAEYGPWSKVEKTHETDACYPNTEYGKSKLELFKWAHDYCEEHRIRLIEPRFFSLYGEGDYEGTMIMSMLRNMINNEPCNLTECIQLWDFLHIDDAIRGLVNLILKESAKGVYNFGSGISKPLKEYVEEMYSITKSHSPLNYGAIPYPKTGVVHTNPCVEKLMRDAEWAPEISFTEGITRIIERQMKNEENKHCGSVL